METTSNTNKSPNGSKKSRRRPLPGGQKVGQSGSLSLEFHQESEKKSEAVGEQAPVTMPAEVAPLSPARAGSADSTSANAGSSRSGRGGRGKKISSVAKIVVEKTTAGIVSEISTELDVPPYSATVTVTKFDALGETQAEAAEAIITDSTTEAPFEEEFQKSTTIEQTAAQTQTQYPSPSPSPQELETVEPLSLNVTSYDDNEKPSTGPFLILECTIPENFDLMSSTSASAESPLADGATPDSSGGATGRSHSRSFTVVHEGRFYEVHTPPDAKPGEVINVIVLPESAVKGINMGPGLFSPGRRSTSRSSQRSSPYTQSDSPRSGSRGATMGSLFSPLTSSSSPSSSSSASASASASRSLSYAAAGFASVQESTGLFAAARGSVASSAVQSLRALLQEKLGVVASQVDRRLRLSERLGDAKSSALATLSQTLASLNDRLVIHDLTPLQWLEEVIFACRKKLGTVVTVAIQVERELQIGDSIRCGVVHIHEAVEPAIDRAIVAFRGIDELLAGGRVGRAIAKAVMLVPPSVLSQLPEGFKERCLGLHQDCLLLASDTDSYAGTDTEDKNKNNGITSLSRGAATEAEAEKYSSTLLADSSCSPTASPSPRPTLSPSPSSTSGKENSSPSPYSVAVSRALLSTASPITAPNVSETKVHKAREVHSQTPRRASLQSIPLSL